jgi:serine protease Do
VLVKEGRMRYPYLGLLLTDVKDLDEPQRTKLGSSAPQRGAFVQELTPGGPAGKAGMRPGDVITEVNSQKINGAGDVVDYVSGQNIGTKVTLHYVRAGRPAQTQVALAELPDEDQRQTAEAQGQGKIGIGLQTLTPDVANSLGLERGIRGAVVTDVVAGSPAERAGLKPGDVVVEVDRKPVGSSEEAIAALRTPQKTGHLLRVRGAGGTRFVTVK